VYILVDLNPLLAALPLCGFATSLGLPDGPIVTVNFALLSITFLMESAAAFLNVRRRRELKPARNLYVP
jgi:hypothetical protein